MSMRTLNILNHTFYPDLPGGVEWRLWHTARAMAQRGIKVRVLTERRTGLAEFEQVMPNLTITRFAGPQANRFTRFHDVRQLARIRWWANILKTRQPDGWIWANGYPMATLGAVLAGRRRDVIFNPSTCVAATNHVARAYPDHEQARLSRAFAALDQLAYRLAPTVLVGSQNLRCQLEEYYGPHDPIHVVPFGVTPLTTVANSLPHERDHARDAARKQFTLPPDACVVGFVGRLEHCKDLPFLLMAAARAIAKWNSHLRLLIVGDGSVRDRLHQLSADLGLTDRICWTGRVDDPASAYAAMDVMALPSVYETFGNVILEAMAAGVPVIGRRRSRQTDSPVLTANDELIRDGVDGLLVDSHDVNDLARRLCELAAYPIKVQQLAKHAAGRADTRTWDEHVGEVIELLSVKEQHAVRTANEDMRRWQAA